MLFVQNPQQRPSQLFAHGRGTGAVKPGSDKVIPLAPEFVRPQDGHEQQDCEINVSLRWLDSRGSQYAALGTTVLGDDLYCHEPFCRALRAKGLEFILVRKADSHKTLYEWVADPDRNRVVKTGVRKRLFDDMKALTTYLCFDSWEHLLDFMLEGWSYTPESRIVRPPKPEIG